MLSRLIELALDNFQLVILGVLAFVALVGLVVIVCMIIGMVGLRRSLDELRRARMEIRSHAPMHAAHRVPYEERLKKVYEERGLKWEEPKGK